MIIKAKFAYSIPELKEETNLLMYKVQLVVGEFHREKQAKLAK